MYSQRVVGDDAAGEVLDDVLVDLPRVNARLVAPVAVDKLHAVVVFVSLGAQVRIPNQPLGCLETFGDWRNHTPRVDSFTGCTMQDRWQCGMARAPPLCDLVVRIAPAVDDVLALALGDVDAAHELGNGHKGLPASTETQPKVGNLTDLALFFGDVVERDVVEFTGEVFVQIGFLGVGLEHLHARRHLPQEVVHAELDPGQVGDDDFMPRRCDERLTQSIGWARVVRVHTWQVLRVIAPA